jgi:hypothetical protein
MFLSPAEIRALTERVQYAAQLRSLRAMGIEHRIRPDGSLAILRSHIEQLFGSTPEKRRHQSTEPNWGALHAARP